MKDGSTLDMNFQHFILTSFCGIIFAEGGYKYQIKGCAGQGGFAKVFKAYVDGNPDEVVVLKVVVKHLIYIFLTF